MRYVLSIKNSTDSKTKGQILSLRNKQDWFLGSITHAQSWDIATLEKNYRTKQGYTSYLTNEYENKYEKIQLYLGINEDVCDNRVYFTFPTILETEERNMMTHVGSYLAYKMTIDVLLYLRPEASKCTAATTWDPEKTQSNFR